MVEDDTMPRLSELCSDFKYELISGDLDAEISDVVYDSRKLKEGAIFVCMEGARFDPHKLIPEAFEKGCRAFVVSKQTPDVEKLKEKAVFILCNDTRSALSYMSRAFFRYPERELRLIGITGTKGKTTAAFMIKAILEEAGEKVGMIGTVGCMIGRDLYPTVNTTPESYEIHRLLRCMADAGCGYAVMECSSQGFKLRRLSGICFDAGVFLNISPDHIGPGEHKDFEEYLWCKSRLIGASKLFLYNAAAEHIDELFDLAGDQKNGQGVRSFRLLSEEAGYAPGQDSSEGQGQAGPGTDGPVEEYYYTAKGLHYISEGDFRGMGFIFSCPGGSFPMRLSMPGIFNAEDALAAVALCDVFGIDMGAANRALSEVRVSGRIETVYKDEDISVIVDYAHNEYSMRNLILTLRNFKPKRIVTVFGCGGDRSKDRRTGMGREAALLCDFTVMTSDNPRTEPPEAIIDDIEEAYLKAGGKRDRYIRICDRREAIRYAMEHAKPGDLIAVIGKGHEMYQEVNGVRSHFSDQEEIRKAGRELKHET